ncbi:hypothetical protein BFX80_06935 [Cobetia marina]|nr:hypothetical protein BFX80_06935 [Cobetia marina]
MVLIQRDDGFPGQILWEQDLALRQRMHDRHGQCHAELILLQHQLLDRGVCLDDPEVKLALGDPLGDLA